MTVELFNLVKEFGIAIVALVALAIYIKSYIDRNYLASITREEEARKDNDAYREYLLQEIKVTREENRKSEVLLAQVVKENTLSNNELRQALTQITSQLASFDMRLARVEDAVIPHKQAPVKTLQPKG